MGHDPNESKQDAACAAPEPDTTQSSTNTAVVGSTTSDVSSCDLTTRFVLPGLNGAAPQVLTTHELSKLLENLQNMELVHEIAVNPEFQLEAYEPADGSLERRIKDTMHKAFWDLLAEELAQTPPCFKHAITLLSEIKESFPQVISENNQRALDHINEVLDESVILQQAEREVLDFRGYAQFIIGIMAKSCAPARDETVRQLNEITNIVDMFRGILETMSLMKLDMANFLLSCARNDIMANSVRYEKKKFQEHLEFYKLGFPATQLWLLRNRTLDEEEQICSNEQALYNAYMELLDWPVNADFPEVIAVDKKRMQKLSHRASSLCLAASAMAIVQTTPIVLQRVRNRAELAKNVLVILQARDGEIRVALQGLFECIKKLVNEASPSINSELESVLKLQLLELANKDALIRSLLWKRLTTCARLHLNQPNQKHKWVAPPGYADYSDELEAFINAFQRIIIYNHSVFGDYFMELLNKHQ